MAEDSTRFKEIFVGQKLAQAFGVNAYVRGKRVRIWVDDYLPMRKVGDDKKDLVYDQISEDGSAWAAILEKVWAKMSNNFELTIGGSQSEIFKTFTGAPTYEMYTSQFNTDTLWKILDESD